jgi:formylglycine-generating enzyme required for sulfatase activity
VMGSHELRFEHQPDEAQHTVELREPFWLASTEVTQQQWHTVMATKPWCAPGADGEPGLQPVTGVAWTDAIEFCAKLTERERAAGRLPDGYRYCLPSEAQWELAARGGLEAADWPHGNEEAVLGEHGFFGGEQLLSQAVAQKRANPFGLFDLAGNVAEWCADAVDGEDTITTPPAADGALEPLSTIGERRVVRGGSFRSPAADLRCAARHSLPPTDSSSELGFRPALARR